VLFRSTPKAFVGACDRFIYTEILRQQDAEDEAVQPSKKPMRELKQDSRLVGLLRNATEDSADETGWANLGTVGQNVANKLPEFDPRNYGYKKLGELVKAVNLFDIDERSSDNSPAKQIYIRDKRRR
jgi:Fe-S-cluster formation regulator IscX/YfhJ